MEIGPPPKRGRGANLQLTPVGESKKQWGQSVFSQQLNRQISAEPKPALDREYTPVVPLSIAAR